MQKHNEEHNFGINFDQLRGNEEEWSKLRKVLDETRQDLESCVKDGTIPVFGYPTVLYDD